MFESVQSRLRALFVWVYVNIEANILHFKMLKLKIVVASF